MTVKELSAWLKTRIAIHANKLDGYKRQMNSSTAVDRAVTRASMDAYQHVLELIDELEPTRIKLNLGYNRVFKAPWGC